MSRIEKDLSSRRGEDLLLPLPLPAFFFGAEEVRVGIFSTSGSRWVVMRSSGMIVGTLGVGLSVIGERRAGVGAGGSFCHCGLCAWVMEGV